MKFLFFCFLFLFYQSPVFAQKNFPFNPNVKGKSLLLKAVEEAKVKQKHVLVIVGRNANKDCKKLIQFINFDNSIYQFIQKNYVTAYLNYSKKNRNYDALAELGFPESHRIPVFVILDSNGKRLKIQNTEFFLDMDDHYRSNKMLAFLKKWDSNFKR